MSNTVPAIGFGWSCQGLLDGPPFIDSVEQRRERNSGSLRPLNKAQGFPIMHDSPISAVVPALFHLRCPSAVRRPSVRNALRAFSARVMAVVVLAVDGSFIGRPTIHVAEKRQIGRIPTVANGYPAIGIAVMGCDGRPASSANRAPCAVFNREGFAGTVNLVMMSFSHDGALR